MLLHVVAWMFEEVAISLPPIKRDTTFSDVISERRIGLSFAKYVCEYFVVLYTIYLRMCLVRIDGFIMDNSL